jgi:tripartite ATP-independent transporter DctM subunit
MMLLLTVALLFASLIALSMPIVFALAVAGIAGLWLGGYPLQQLSSALVSGSQSWVLLAIPAFVFAGNLMERCGMSHALVELARAMVGWVRGGLGMSVIVVAYFFSDICGSKMAEVSALGSSLMPPLTRAGYDRRDSASLIAAGTAMGMLVPPAIFMIVLAQVTNTSAVALFVAGFVPALVMMIFLMAVVYVRARMHDWPIDAAPSVKRLGRACLHAAVPMVVPFVILGGFVFGVITATEAGAVVAAYAFAAAMLYYRNVSWREMGAIAYDSAILTAAVVFLLAVASIYQYLMGVSGVPQMLADVLGPLKTHPWLFLMGTAFVTVLFGMVLEGLPAAVVLIPVVFPIAEAMGIDPIHFNIVQTAAVGIGLFLPPMGVGLLMALRFADLGVAEHFPTYVPYLFALAVGLVLIICVPEISLALPRLAGLIR